MSSSASSDKGDCSICDAPTHGMHFGVSTCKACASFFRRSMVERKRYKCRYQDACVINNKVRNNCRACRLKKCYLTGMVREASPAPTEHPPLPASLYGGDTRCPSTAVISPQSSFCLSPPQLPTTFASNFLYNLSAVTTTPAMPAGYLKLPATPEMVNLYPRVTRLLQAFRSFQNSMKSLYKIENPHAIFEPEEFKQGEKTQYDRLETGTASLIMSMVNEFFPSFFKLSAEDRIKVFRPFAVRFSILYRVYISAVYFNTENDTRICTHYGYYNSVETLDLFFGEIPNVAEVKALAAPLFQKLNQIKRKAIRIGLREADVSAIIGLIYFSEAEDSCGLDFEDTKHKKEIQTEVFNNIVATYGFDRAGIQLAEVLSIINDINSLCVISTESMIIGDLILPKNQALQTWLCADQRYR